MSNELNFPYAVELAAMAQHSGDKESFRDTAGANGVPGETFDRLSEMLEPLSSPPSTMTEFSHTLYLLDGAARGYIDPPATPSAWVCGQAANEHYGR